MAMASRSFSHQTLMATILMLGLLTGGVHCWYQLTDLLSSCNGAVPASETGIISAQGFTDGVLSDCSLLLTSMPNRQLVLSIENLQVRNIHLFHRSCDNYLQIFSGPSQNSTGTAVSRPLCSHVSDQQDFIVTDKFVRIQLHTAGAKYVHFRMVYTNAVPLSNCTAIMFSCRTTRLCVDRQLICDKHNNCGDYSDENQALAQCQIITYYHVHLAASLACSLIVLLTIGFAIFYCTRPREPRWYRMKKEDGEGVSG